jgi:DNA-binding GntR family transcriptional regulator
VTARRFEKPPTTQEMVLDELRRRIRTGELKPGAPIRQNTLADDLGVSRFPLREGLRVLEGEGQVVYERHKGYSVAQLDVDDLVEIFRIRLLLEAEAVHSAMDHVTPDLLHRLSAALKDLERGRAEGDIPAAAEANWRFLSTVYETARRPRLVRLIRILWDAADPYRWLYFNEPSLQQVGEKQYREILVAVEHRDADRLVELLQEHRDDVVATVRTLLGHTGRDEAIDATGIEGKG